MTAVLDPRLIFLARAWARFILVEAGEIDLDEATEDLIWPACDCLCVPMIEEGFWTPSWREAVRDYHHARGRRR
jgi:hypothetical protein